MITTLACLWGLCAGASHAHVPQLTPPSCPSPTLSEKIDAAISPGTDFISGWVFAQIPIIGADKEAKAVLRIDDAKLRDGDTLSIDVGGSALALEVDTNGLVCSGASAATPSALAPAQLAETLVETLPEAVRVSQDGQEIVITAPTELSPSLSVSGAAINSTGFSDGSAGIPFIVIWLLTGAAFFTVKMGFVNIRGLKQSLRIVRGTYDNPNDPGEVTHFQALTAALSGTVGLGNIAGVAAAVSLGGPGATFWMILAGLLGMSSKFTECTLGVFYRQISTQGVVSGGPMYYLRTGLAEKGQAALGKFLAGFFAVLCIGGAFGAGNMFQVNQSAEQVLATLVPLTGGDSSPLAGSPWIVGLLYAFFVGLVIIGGIRSITKVTAKLVPLMAFIYLSGALTVIGLNITAIPGAFAQIVVGAFTPGGVTGGII
ncbi:MAG: alanine:cation symporter family protein, partial [Pseudomonadota bacterium]